MTDRVRPFASPVLLFQSGLRRWHPQYGLEEERERRSTCT